MTEQQLYQKTLELMEQVSERISDQIKTALKSGAINLDQYEDNYLLPKILVTAILRQNADDYEPIGARDKKEVKNIGYIL